MTTTAVPVDGGTVHVLATVQGLASEEERVRRAFAEARPRVVALGVSAESVAGLLHHIRRKDEPPPAAAEDDGDDPYEYDAEELLTDAEFAYGVALQRYGKVLLPPRDLLAAVTLAQEAGVPVFGVDFSEERYSEVFARNVSTFALLRYTRRSRKLERRPPDSPTARDFAIEWDAQLRRVRGIAAVEAARERHIAESARALAREHGDVLLVVEVAREAGVLAALRTT